MWDSNFCSPVNVAWFLLKYSVNLVMVRTIITPKKNHIQLDIPNEYVGKEIEVTFSAVDEVSDSNSKKSTMADFWACLSDKSAVTLHNHVEQTRNEWDRNI